MRDMTWLIHTCDMTHSYARQDPDCAQSTHIPLVMPPLSFLIPILKSHLCRHSWQKSRLTFFLSAHKLNGINSVLYRNDLVSSRLLKSRPTFQNIFAYVVRQRALHIQRTLFRPKKQKRCNTLQHTSSFLRKVGSIWRVCVCVCVCTIVGAL